jgi:hypothetical protein
MAALALGGRPDGGEAVGVAGRHGAGTALVLEAKRTTVRVRRLGLRRVAEDVIDEAQEGAQPSA